MPLLELDDVTIAYEVTGPDDGAPVVFANSLGTDLRLWEPILPLLPEGLRILRFDNRGHGNSSAPPAPYNMGTLVRDAERVMDAVSMKDALFVGLSIGGMIAQGLAVKRLDLVRGLVLSNTGAKIGTPQMWQERIDQARAEGIGPMADASMQRWFSADFQASDALPYWREMFLSTPVEGYCGCAAAIAGTDFITTTSGLRLPALAIAGSEDKSTPPDLVREMIDLIPASEFCLIKGGGHLPHVERPEEYVGALIAFMRRIGHL